MIESLIKEAAKRAIDGNLFISYCADDGVFRARWFVHAGTRYVQKRYTATTLVELLKGVIEHEL